MDSDDSTAQLKQAVYLTVAQMVEQELAAVAPGVAATPRFTALLAALVYQQAITLGEDLEMFAQHAGRKVVLPADVYMATRRNSALTEYLKEVEAATAEEAAGAGEAAGAEAEDTANQWLSP